MEINAGNITKFEKSLKKEPTVVFYYASWCGYCISFKPVWDSFVKVCKKKYPVIKLAKVESLVIPSLNYDPNVTGYPTVKFYNKNLNENNEFKGDRSVDNLVNFLKEHTQKKGINLSSLNKVNKKLSRKKSLNKKKSKKGKSKKLNNEYIVFGASWCIYCKKTKELLDSKGIKYKYYDIDDEQTPKKLEKYKKKIPSHLKNMIPIIFKNNKYIEGYSGLLKILE